MISIADVERADFGALTRAGGRLGVHAGAMQQQQRTGRQSVYQLHDGWDGQASVAATTSAERNLQQQQRLTDAVQRLQLVLSAGGARLTTMRAGLLQNVERLEQQGWQVSPDGTVSVRPGSPLAALAVMSPVTAMQLMALSATNSVAVKQQLADIEAQDQQLAQKLADAINDLPQDLPGDAKLVGEEEFKGLDDDEPSHDDDPVPGPDQNPGDPGYKVPHAPGDPADYPSQPGWKSDAQGMVNPPGYPPMPPGAQRDENWRNYLNGVNPDGSRRVNERTPPEAYPLPEAVQDKGLKLVGAAENQQGTRYVWGGGNKDGTTRSGLHDGGGLADQRRDYEHSGFDCSGLSEYSIYQATGYDPAHFSGDQYQNIIHSRHGIEVFTGPNLDTSNLQPGDIIYYSGASGVAGGQHVAIYMGNGVTVETNTSGTPVHSQSATTFMNGGNIRVVRPQ